MSVCYIFAALPMEELPYIPKSDDYIMAADKGVMNLKKFNISPDVVIGDFDSLGAVPNGENVIKLPIEKDDTDVGYCIKYAMKKGYNEFVVYGAIGGLTDHSYANTQLAVYVSKRGGKAVFVGNDTFVTAITDGSLTIENGSGRLSVFCVGKTAKGVSYKGMKYLLDGADLSHDFPLGVSNEIIEKNAEISVKDGTLLIISQSKI